MRKATICRHGFWWFCLEWHSRERRVVPSLNWPHFLVSVQPVPHCHKSDLLPLTNSESLNAWANLCSVWPYAQITLFWGEPIPLAITLRRNAQMLSKGLGSSCTLTVDRGCEGPLGRVLRIREEVGPYTNLGSTILLYLFIKMIPFTNHDS